MSPLVVLIKLALMKVPSYIFQALSMFNWTTWGAPNNVMLAAVTGMTPLLVKYLFVLRTYDQELSPGWV
jgi:hypothetical protein